MFNIGLGISYTAQDTIALQIVHRVLRRAADRDIVYFWDQFLLMTLAPSRHSVSLLVLFSFSPIG